MNDPLDELTTQLEAAARRLRSGELDADAAADVVAECARLASEAAAELDRRAGAAAGGPLPGQGELL
jgi:hypothetical protein